MSSLKIEEAKQIIYDYFDKDSRLETYSQYSFPNESMISINCPKSMYSFGVKIKEDALECWLIDDSNIVEKNDIDGINKIINLIQDLFDHSFTTHTYYNDKESLRNIQVYMSESSDEKITEFVQENFEQLFDLGEVNGIINVCDFYGDKKWSFKIENRKIKEMKYSEV